jgi:FkbM family methyltransferase
MVTVSLSIKAATGTQLHALLSKDGDYEPEVFSTALHFLRGAKNAFFLNVGSNIGLFPLAAAKFSQGRAGGSIDVYAHEPLPYLQDVSRALKIENEVDYELSATAVSDFAGTADFYVSAKSDASNSLVKNFRPAREVIQVKVDTLDNLYLKALQRKQFGEVVLMIDVETAEPAVLRGGSQLMRLVRPIIICEVLAGRNETDLERIVSEAGYSAYRFDGEQWGLESHLRGDQSHKHRDWLFIPDERAKVLGRNIQVPTSSPVSFVY